MQKHLILIGLLACTSLSFSPREVESQPTTERQPERGSGRKD